MAYGSLSPVAIQQFFDANGNPLAGGKLFFYLAGTTTLTPAYADIDLTVPLDNPIILDAAGRAPELFLDALTYKQVLQNAGGVTIWTADNIVTPAALRSVGTSNSLSGNQHDVPVPKGVIGFIDFRNTAPLTIDGFANGTPGQVLILRALGTAPVNLLHGTVSTSQTGNHLHNYVGSGPTTIVPASGSAMYLYQEASWILIQHEQGAWIPVPFDPANFTASPSGAWTVAAGDVRQLHYRLSGTSVLFTIALAGTTVAGAPVQVVIEQLPYAFVTAVDGLTAMAKNGGVLPMEPCLMGMAANSRRILFARVTVTPWTNVTDGMELYAQVQLDVS